MNIKTGPNDRQPPEPVEEVVVRVKIEVGAIAISSMLTAQQLNDEVRYSVDTNQFLVMFDTCGGTASYPSQFDSCRIYSDMTLGAFVNECKIFIEEIRVEIGCAIVRSYK